MTILLAPMEGLLDASLRDVLTRLGGIDRCVSEFIRITDRLLPARVFRRLMPELDHGSCTPSGVPVRAQLLGSDPVCLAENASLLAIVSAVRRAVPAALPVSAKMRLGNQDCARMIDAAQALAAGGACELVVHGRTKAQGYRPPAFWDRIAAIREAVAIPVIANGEIWTLADAQRCRAESGCAGLMLGRGAVADPGLALAIAAPGLPVAHWGQLLPLLAAYWQLIAPHTPPRHRPGRIKQWLNLLRRRHPEAQAAYDAVRLLHSADEVERCLFGDGVVA